MSELPDTPFEPIDDTGDTDEINGEESLSEPADGPMGRLFDGDAPGPQVRELRDQYDMPQWAAIISRGVMRVATGSGVPPIAEILIGTVMGFLGSDMSVTGSDGDEQQSGDTSNGAPPGVEL